MLLEFLSTPRSVQSTSVKNSFKFLNLEMDMFKMNGSVLVLLPAIASQRSIFLGFKICNLNVSS